MKKRCLSPVLLLPLLMLTAGAAADTITVCPDGSCDHVDIQSAIDAAAWGDVIEIVAGTYQPVATLNTNGKPITLRGEVDGEGVPVTVIEGLGLIRVLECTSGEGAAPQAGRQSSCCARR